MSSQRTLEEVFVTITPDQGVVLDHRYKEEPVQPEKQSRKVRVIKRDSFGYADRGDDWCVGFSATWWHQMRGVKGFHSRFLNSWWPKSEHPEPPTLEHVLATYNEETSHTWELSE